jgi:hypothetical protein
MNSGRGRERVAENVLKIGERKPQHVLHLVRQPFAEGCVIAPMAVVCFLHVIRLPVNRLVDVRIGERWK